MKKREDLIYSRTGIYGIRNRITRMIYVGRTGYNFGDRWDCHRSLLNNNKHRNKGLQDDWNKYGIENFEFVIIEECASNELVAKEKFYIQYYKDQKLAYNIFDTGRPMAADTKRKIGEKNRIHGLGRKASEETRRKMSEAHKNQIRQPVSEAGRLKMQKAQQKRYEENPKKLTVGDVKEIRRLRVEDNLSYSAIARQYNVSPQCISDICHYKRWKQIP